MRRALVVLAAALSVSVVAPANAGAATKQDLTIRMSDGVDLAATLFTPDETSQSLPAVILMHGLGEHRNKLNAVGITINDVAEQYLVPQGYVALTFDQRGQGRQAASTGSPANETWPTSRSSSIGWTRARTSTVHGSAPTRIPAAAAPSGGPLPRVCRSPRSRTRSRGQISIARSSPEPDQEWRGARVPERDGAIHAGVARIQGRPLLQPQPVDDQDAFRLALGQSSLSGIRVPTLLLQGRRDFLFDLEHAFAAYRQLAEAAALPRRLRPRARIAPARGDSARDDARTPLVRPMAEESPTASTPSRRSSSPVTRGPVRPPRSGPSATRTMTFRFRGTSIGEDGKVVRTVRLPETERDPRARDRARAGIGQRALDASRRCRRSPDTRTGARWSSARAASQRA